MATDDAACRRRCVRIADVDLVAAAEAAWIRGLRTADEQAAVGIFRTPEFRGHLEVAEIGGGAKKPLRPRLLRVAGRRNRL
jgi:hypothetical protein